MSPMIRVLGLTDEGYLCTRQSLAMIGSNLRILLESPTPVNKNCIY